MTEYCYFCKAQNPRNKTLVKVNGKYETACWDCYKKHKNDMLEERLKSVNHAADFKDWKMCDMSEMFWVHLGKYKTHPNKRSLDIIHLAYCWACHEDHGLSNSFCHALEWCNLKFYDEFKRTDLPDE